jgi:NADPH:quinone reductase-like Zn-dependent oxidoreductase
MNSPDGTMRAMQASDSDAASLSLDQVPVPQPGPGEVLVRVAATAVTAQELTWPEKWPAIPCHDLSGVVAGSGPGGTGWADGTEVFGLVGFDRPGAAAEYVTVPAADLAAKPAAVDHVAAAAIPLGGLTAWQALHDHADLQPGQHVLVHGGAGGVGAYAVQVAAALGAQVTATASTRDAAYVANLGAHRVINYKGRFEDELSDVDVVVDPVGGDALARSWTVLKPGGILVAIAEEPPEDKGGRDDVRALYFVVEPSGAQMGELARLVDGGKLHAAVSTTFALGDLREAFAAQQARSHPGKVVITVA